MKLLALDYFGHFFANVIKGWLCFFSLLLLPNIGYFKLEKRHLNQGKGLTKIIQG